MSKTWLHSTTHTFYGTPFNKSTKELASLLKEAAKLLGGVRLSVYFADDEVEVTHGYEHDRLFVNVRLKDNQ